MIEYGPHGDLIIKGTMLPIHQLWEHFDKFELVNDMLEGKIWGAEWKEDTLNEKKIADFLGGSTPISGKVVENYFKLKEFERKEDNKYNKILEKVEYYDKKLDNLTKIIQSLNISVLKPVSYTHLTLPTN